MGDEQVYENGVRSVDSCGCVWYRLPPGGAVSGDVVGKLCPTHTPDPVSATLVDLAMVAWEVATGRKTENEAARVVAEMCMRHGPENVRNLDAYFERKLDEKFAELNTSKVKVRRG